MGVNTNYDSLQERFNKIRNGEVPKKTKEGKEETKFGKIKRILNTGNEDLYKLREDEGMDYFIMDRLNKFNDFVNHGHFGSASHTAKEIASDIIYAKNSELSKEDRLKYLDSFNKRIERGIKYLEKDPSNKNIRDMGEILGYSKKIEERLNPPPSSGLEKSLVISGSLALIGSLFFLTPSFTGNVIGNLNYSGIIGGALFILGIGLLVIRKK